MAQPSALVAVHRTNEALLPAFDEFARMSRLHHGYYMVVNCWYVSSDLPHRLNACAAPTRDIGFAPSLASRKRANWLLGRRILSLSSGLNTVKATFSSSANRKILFSRNGLWPRRSLF